MERVLHNKVCYLSRQNGYEITIITSDQGDSPLFFTFPDNVKIIDLGINYNEAYNLSPVKRLLFTQKKKVRHRLRLERYLKEFPADIVVALYPSEVTFLHKLKDGSKKIVEFHSNRWFRLKQGYQGLHKLIAYCRLAIDHLVARKADKFVVLTKAGAKQWGRMHNMVVIPNSVTLSNGNSHYPISSRRVIAVGRLIHEKGFDRLLEAWSKISDELLNTWKLDIFGQGVLKDYLLEEIRKLNIQDSASIKEPTNDIFNEYSQSAFLVMSSRSEGFGMVMIEAMSCGIPVISYNFKCGPEDMIDNNLNGILVPEGNIQALAQAMQTMMKDTDLRIRMSDKARNKAIEFSEDVIMKKWEDVFSSLLKSS